MKRMLSSESDSEEADVSDEIPEDEILECCS